MISLTIWGGVMPRSRDQAGKSVDVGMHGMTSRHCGRRARRCWSRPGRPTAPPTSIDWPGATRPAALRRRPTRSPSAGKPLGVVDNDVRAGVERFVLAGAVWSDLRWSWLLPNDRCCRVPVRVVVQLTVPFEEIQARLSPCGVVRRTCMRRSKLERARTPPGQCGRGQRSSHSEGRRGGPRLDDAANTGVLLVRRHPTVQVPSTSTG